MMRTTVTLDADVERMLRDNMHRTRRSFKETLNQAIRAGLTARRPPNGKGKPFVLEVRSMGLRQGIDPAALNKLADELEVDAVRALAGRSTRTESAN